jgi:hypothetical protein
MPHIIEKGEEQLVAVVVATLRGSAAKLSKGRAGGRDERSTL